MLKYITWNNIVKFWLVLVIIIVFIIYKTITRDPAEMLLSHLENKYNKKFEIIIMGKRDNGYKALLYPKELEKLGKISDSYYWFDGQVRYGSVGDNYNNVLLQLSANEYFLPKLEELFGKNVLPILKIDNIYSPKFTDFKKELADIKKTEELYNIDKYFPISGGIYIFGRVENDKDREWYRKQIYEFVQFMKQTGTFEYVSLGINIVDERCLTDYFKKNIANLLEAKQKYNTSSEFIIYRDRIFKEAEKEFKQMSEKEKQKRINEFNKSSLLENDIEGYGVVYHAGILSPKFKDSEPRAKSKRKEYNDIKDVELLNTMKILYMEYYRKEDGEIVEK